MVVARERNGHAIYWNGHLCEGDRLVEGDLDTFVPWTRCGKHDVPRNAAWRSDLRTRLHAQSARRERPSTACKA